MRIVGLLVLLAGCRAIFGFESATVVDATVPDLAPDASECTELGVSCAGDSTLRACTAVGELPTDTACSWGCIDTPAPHCGELDPTGAVVTTQDLSPDGALLDQDISAAITISSNTGAMGVVRPAGIGVINGISFQVRGGIGIFRFKSVAFHGAVLLTGTAPVAFVADGAIVVDTLLDARGPCLTSGGPGGDQGGNSSGNGQGVGGGGRGSNAGVDASGGGGGGFGARGSSGGSGTLASGGTPGNPFGDLEITILGGGSGGGGGGRGSGGDGGGGGGAVFLASNTSIRIQTGAGINAGGCGGRGAQDSDGGGGGGGSGGAILLEAPVVTLEGGLGVNGGGGGAGGSKGNGENAPLTNAATGGISAVDGNGGNGGAGTTFSGTAGESDSPAGGGGGAVGRIRINTRTGIVDGAGLTSPPFDAPGTSATRSTAVVR